MMQKALVKLSNYCTSRTETVIQKYTNIGVTKEPGLGKEFQYQPMHVTNASTAIVV